MYRIRSYSYAQAKKIGVEIRPSKRRGKKIDVFKNGKKVASIGAVGYMDYPTYLAKYGQRYANERRRLYKKRHSTNRRVVGSAGYYADKILW
jgi:hypothetical protein